MVEPEDLIVFCNVEMVFGVSIHQGRPEIKTTFAVVPEGLGRGISDMCLPEPVSGSNIA